MKKTVYLGFGVHNVSNTAFFNCYNDRGEQIDSFVIDFNTNEKLIYSNAPNENELRDISLCGTKVLTIDITYEKKKRKTKIFNIKSSELLFETNIFFGYEALFTSIPHLLVVRADIKGKSDDKLFIFDTQKNEIVHFMQGNNPLEYCGLYASKSIFVYPSSRKKDEVILLDLHTLTETVLHLGSKKLIHRVLPIGNDEFFAIDGDYFGIKFNSKGDIIWKTQKLNWDTFYYAPYFFCFENQIVFDAQHRINLTNGEFISKQVDIKGRLTPYFHNLAMTNTGAILNLSTDEMTELDIEKLSIGR
ncbi:MAG: hypothetical protein Q4C98_11815 [Capnocytophaga sp.]|nr:hypothetical protein [Capnocytophaga sp.]